MGPPTIASLAACNSIERAITNLNVDLWNGECKAMIGSTFIFLGLGCCNVQNMPGSGIIHLILQFPTSLQDTMNIRIPEANQIRTGGHFLIRKDFQTEPAQC